MLPTPTRSDRINVRIKPAVLQQLREMVIATGISVSEVVRISLNAEYQRMHADAARRKPSAMVAAAGRHRSDAALAGRLSQDYKRLLASGLSAKHRNAAG